MDARSPCRDALAAAEAGGDQVPGVAAVGLGAGRADGCAAVAAGLERHAVRLVLGGVGLADLAGALVGLLDAAGQPHRVGAGGGPHGPNSSSGGHVRATSFLERTTRDM